MKVTNLLLIVFLFFSGCSYGLRRDLCGLYRTGEEFRACERGRIRAEERNHRDRLYRAERSGYDLHRRRDAY